MKRLFYSLILVFIVPIAFGQITLTVNTPVMGVNDGTSLSLDQAASQAVSLANTGEDVIINLNVPDTDGDGKALIPIPATTTSVQSLINFNNTNGSITLTKDPISTTEQGLDGIDLSDGSQARGIACNSSRDITISNLTFDNFFTPSSGQNHFAIAAQFSDNISIINNNFNTSNIGVFFLSSSGIINENEFIDQNRAGILYTEHPTIPISSDFFQEIRVENNTMDYSSSFINTGNRDGVVIDFRHPNLGLSVFINDNTIRANSQCLEIVNRIPIGFGADMVINGNILTGNGTLDGIVMVGPRSNWIVENNVLTNFQIGISLSSTCTLGSPCPNPGDETDWTIDFIESNSFGATPVNTGNVFNNCIISFNSNLENHNRIIGYDIEGRINVTQGRPTSVIETKIRHFSPVGAGSQSTPLRITPAQGPLENTFSIESATRSDGNLTVNYSLSSFLLPATGDFWVEFFEADGFGNVLSYIGREFHTTADIGNSFTASFSGADFTEGDRLAMSFTSTGTIGDNPLGTSHFRYETIDQTQEPCDTCNSFKPIVGREYWISAWINVGAEEDFKTYDIGEDGPGLELIFSGAALPPTKFLPTGEIIDDWQRIVGRFVIPTGTLDFILGLESHPDFPTYFDDVRIHPLNGSFKSYVYDGETFWLTAELDDNNYATYYEYDEEGGLIRIKKETVRGIVTIQETRSNTTKSIVE